MKDSAKLRRHLHIIRCLDAPHRYPSLQKLTEFLRDHDIESISAKTVENDLRDIRADYSITITYDRTNRGYFLDLAADEDLDDFRTFVRLLERRERLEFLTTSGRLAGRYMQLEHDAGGAAARFRGLDLLAPLWNALQRGVSVSFRYQNYADGADTQRLVEPGLLVEYKNRWYLDGYDLNRQGVRTFGLDRISDLTLTTQAMQPNRGIEYRANRQHVIGVTAPPGTPVERVVLRFAQPEAEYVRALPLHGSQEILAETADFLTLSIRVMVNTELKRDILAYGKQVEVLEPLSLHEAIAEQILIAASFYDPIKK